ncbi:MAG: hypothetical protein DMF95_17745 [Acidobacteria bacterium]|nr:MAG: hypothetical protein DMF96_04990 [Acidobacteriota bacterium]PYR14925.1 MAG: hypothetical protein DMF94_33540 [Acidobacteriota bacterium]PYR46803.1 MAG: hypothetical protein DMF95_17745 [Acidobacteriota bacterium]
MASVFRKTLVRSFHVRYFEIDALPPSGWIASEREDERASTSGVIRTGIAWSAPRCASHVKSPTCSARAGWRPESAASLW